MVPIMLLHYLLPHYLGMRYSTIGRSPLEHYKKYNSIILDIYLNEIIRVN